MDAWGGGDIREEKNRRTITDARDMMRALPPTAQDQGCHRATQHVSLETAVPAVPVKLWRETLRLIARGVCFMSAATSRPSMRVSP